MPGELPAGCNGSHRKSFSGWAYFDPLAFSPPAFLAWPCPAPQQRLNLLIAFLSTPACCVQRPPRSPSSRASYKRAARFATEATVAQVLVSKYADHPFEPLGTCLLDRADLLTDQCQPRHVAPELLDDVCRQAVPSAVPRPARRSGALRRCGLSPRIPRRASALFMRLMMRERSLTRLSRSRFGRFASSSSIVGIASVPQCPRSPLEAQKVQPILSSTSLAANAIPGPSPRSHGSADISLHSVHLDELDWQMKVAVIILNPTFLVFIQLVAT
jgi:hypothetical protein